MSFAVDLASTEVEVDETDAELSDLVVGDEVNVQTKTAKGDTQVVARKISVEHEEESPDEDVTLAP